MLALRRSHHRCSKLVQCTAWAHTAYGIATRLLQDELCIRAADIDRHPGPKRALLLRGRDVPMQDALPTAAQHYDGRFRI